VKRAFAGRVVLDPAPENSRVPFDVLLTLFPGILLLGLERICTQISVVIQKGVSSPPFSFSSPLLPSFPCSASSLTFVVALHLTFFFPILPSS